MKHAFKRKHYTYMDLALSIPQSKTTTKKKKKQLLNFYCLECSILIVFDYFHSLLLIENNNVHLKRHKSIPCEMRYLPSYDAASENEYKSSDKPRKPITICVDCMCIWEEGGRNHLLSQNVKSTKQKLEENA